MSDEPQAPESQITGALDGIRVVNAGQIIAGPFTATLLAEFGADVIKVEAPANPAVRTVQFAQDHRGQRGVTINFQHPDGAALFRKLCATSDVLVENYRPGTLERLGLSPDELRKENPGLIAVRISGYGQTGPYRDRTNNEHGDRRRHRDGPAPRGARTARAATDPIFTDPGSLDGFSTHYVGADNREHPLASPIFADLHGLPPILMQVADAEVLLDDTLNFAKRAQEAGVRATVTVEPHGFHIYHYFLPEAPETLAAIGEIGGFLRAHG